MIPSPKVIRRHARVVLILSYYDDNFSQLPCLTCLCNDLILNPLWHPNGWIRCATKLVEELYVHLTDHPNPSFGGHPLHLTICQSYWLIDLFQYSDFTWMLFNMSQLTTRFNNKFDPAQIHPLKQVSYTVHRIIDKYCEWKLHLKMKRIWYEDI